MSIDHRVGADPRVRPGADTWVGPYTAVMMLALAAATASVGAAQRPPAAALTALTRECVSQTDGDIPVPGVREPVEVIRDRWGVPHIYARNVDDLFFAQGYVIGQDRLWQLEMWRRQRSGRLAEILGPRAFDRDSQVRLLMYRG